MKVGWLVDKGETIGGAEFTQAEFRTAAPEGVEIVDCPPGAVDPDCDRYVAQNVVRYTLDDFLVTEGRTVIKYNHDVGPWVKPDVTDWLRQHAVHICCSPLQAEYMQLGAILIPPPVDLARFEKAAESVNGNRAGAVSVGSWRNHGKAPHKAQEWAAGNGGIDFYGGGPWAPQGSQEVAYDAMPHLLAGYATFVYLPTVIEPFGRVVAEAWAAGCELVINGLVGAKYWLEENPGAIETAAIDFWRVVVEA